MNLGCKGGLYDIPEISFLARKVFLNKERKKGGRATERKKNVKNNRVKEKRKKDSEKESEWKWKWGRNRADIVWNVGKENNINWVIL